MAVVDSSFLQSWDSLGEDYFLVHFDDALLVANEFFLSPTVVNYTRIESTVVPSVKIPKKDEKFLRFIVLTKQLRVVVYEASGKSARGKEWKIAAQASPGNLTELEAYVDLNNGKSEDSTLLAVNIQWVEEECNVSLAFCNLEDHALVVGEFVDSPLLPNLEAAILQLGARECLLPSGLLAPDLDQTNSSQRPKVKSLPFLQLVLERSNVLVTELKKKEDFTDASEDLDLLVKPEKSGGPSSVHHLLRHKSELSEAFCCLGAIVNFLRLKSNESMIHSFTVSRFSLKNFVRLDSAALRTLHLLPSPDAVNRYQSVFGVLNHCRTEQGQRLLAQWLRQPLTDIIEINERLDLVEAFVEDGSLRQSFHGTVLRRIPDIPRLARRLRLSKGRLHDVYSIYVVVSLLSTVISSLRQYEGRNKAALQKCFITSFESAAEDFKKFAEMVNATIDLDAAKQGELLIKAEVDEELEAIKEKMTKTESKIFKEFRKVSQEIGLEPNKTIKLENSDELGYYFRVTLKMEKHIRGLHWLKKIDLQKSGVRFRSADLSSLNEQYIELKSSYDAAQKTIVKEILSVTAGYLEPLYALGATTAFLDVIVSLATAAVSAPQQYVRPRFVPRDRGCIRIKDFRHPCLEMQSGVNVIANDVHLQRGKRIFKTITGPNMGGKSTYIRGTGLLMAMAQMGSFLPCSEAELVPVDAIMARVGAADCQLRGISTFMAEMLETVSVLKLATRDSLVIIDELGRGTSTYDGLGLAWSISSSLANEVGCFTLFATHFHELTSLALVMPTKFANYRVAAQVITDSENALTPTGGGGGESKVVMLYKVEPGICDQSYGLQVAHSVGLPAELVSYAETASSHEERLESLWVRLEEASHRKAAVDQETSDENSKTDECRPLNSLNAVLVAERTRTRLISCISTAASQSVSPSDFSSTLQTEIDRMLDEERETANVDLRQLLKV
ncbi:hypothetical protein AAHC03_0397 [Spirometra sp. Aus1]